MLKIGKKILKIKFNKTHSASLWLVTQKCQEILARNCQWSGQYWQFLYSTGWPRKKGFQDQEDVAQEYSPAPWMWNTFSEEGGYQIVFNYAQLSVEYVYFNPPCLKSEHSVLWLWLDQILEPYDYYAIFCIKPDPAILNPYAVPEVWEKYIWSEPHNFWLGTLCMSA